MATNTEVWLGIFAACLGVGLVVAIMFVCRERVQAFVHYFRGPLTGSEAVVHSDADRASRSGMYLNQGGDEIDPLQVLTEQEARDQLEGAASGREEPRPSVAELVDFQNTTTIPDVGEEQYIEGADLHPGTGVNPHTLDTIEEAPGGMHPATVDAEQGAEEDFFGEETPLTDQGHAGGIIPISLALQTNHGKQEVDAQFQLASGYNTAPSRDECRHLCLNGGFGPRVDQCDCTGYIEPLTGLGPLERRELSA